MKRKPHHVIDKFLILSTNNQIIVEPKENATHRMVVDKQTLEMTLKEIGQKKLNGK